jgi:hypothetical protein
MMMLDEKDQELDRCLDPAEAIRLGVAREAVGYETRLFLTHKRNTIEHPRHT